ncbi:Twin-arginine translocation protein TatC [hydrothermal vent metagenome]|uniref:Twin-arginine translocation protein TatC n=1 Tax=hydrothermal vent metagenome TaxID=652676 RepID=A0A3B0SH37_9ZZZZ
MSEHSIAPPEPDEEPDEMEASRAPLLEHLVELRTRLIHSFLAILLAFGVCFFFAQDIYNFLLDPFLLAAKNARAANDADLELSLIFTGPLEFFFAKMKLALFGALLVAFPFLAFQIYRFVAPGLYHNERGAFFPFLIASPVLFFAGASFVYYVMLPMVMRFAFHQEQAANAGQVAIQLLPRVSEYLSLVTTLILAFGFSFQLPVILSLLGRVGIVSSAGLRKGRKYAVVGILAFAAFFTPPDVISQFLLGIPVFLLYEISIWSVRLIEKKRAETDEEEDAAASV